jgi:hypothetical protein
MTTHEERRYAGPEGTTIEQADALPTHFLECRTIGHAWSIRWWGNIGELPDELVPQVVRSFQWDLIRVSTCLRCNTIRDEFYPRASRVADSFHRFQCQYRRYRYSSGYQVPGNGRPDRRIFSKVAFERWTAGEAFLK